MTIASRAIRPRADGACGAGGPVAGPARPPAPDGIASAPPLPVRRVARSGGRSSRGPCSLDHHQHAAGLDRRARRHGDVLDAARLGRAQLVLHLHRFDDDDRLARRRPRRPAATSTRTTRPGIGATIDCCAVAVSGLVGPAAPGRRPSTVAADGASVEPHQALSRRRRRRRPAPRGSCPRRRRGCSDSARVAGTRRRRRRADVPVDRDPEPRRRPIGSTATLRLRPSTSTSNVIRAAPLAAGRCAATGCRCRAALAVAGARRMPSRYASSAAAMRRQLFGSAASSSVNALAAPRRRAADRDRSCRTVLRGTRAARISHWKNGMVVRMPSTWYSRSARAIRAIASAGRSSPQATSFAISES